MNKINSWKYFFLQRLNETGKISLKTCSLISGINNATLEWYFQKEFKKEKNLKVWEVEVKIEEIAKKGYFNIWKLWKRLNIDEKNLWNKVYTIYSNPDLWSKWLVWIFPWVLSKEIINKTKFFCKNKDLSIVKEVSMDMANTMKKIIEEVFPWVVQVIDRFHVMKNVLEDMWALISKNKTEIKKAYLEEQEQAKKERRKVKHQRYWNWETLLEIITRWRHQLLKRRKDWNIEQHLRWNCFELVPQLQEIFAMYKEIEELFDIYDFSTCKKSARKRFEKWFTRISKLDFITELQNSWRMIKNHFDRICNYFRTWLTNWYAEGLNSRIQRLLSNSRGFKSEKFMLYRIIKVFG